MADCDRITDKKTGRSGSMRSRRKVRLDVTVPAETKEKLVRYAERRNLSLSVVVQMLIEESCG